MLKNKKINLGIIKKVSKALGELNEQVAYVGGATVSLYADDPAADDVRPQLVEALVSLDANSACVR